MSDSVDIDLKRIRVRAGVYEGVATCSPATDEPPQIVVIHHQKEVPGVELEPGEAAGIWHLRFAIPAGTVCDGVQSFIFTDKQDNRTLDSFAIAAGDPLTGDLQAELDLLRAELDMLKRAFRRHCSTHD